jgi:hypothetical protein
MNTFKQVFLELNNMILNACRTLCLFCFIFLFIFCTDTYAVPAPAISAMRIQKISKVISKYKEACENLEDNDVVDTILKDVSEFYRLEPEAKKNEKTTQEISKSVREKVTQKFPDSYETLKNKAEEEAGKIFVKSNILDYVSVKYLKGEKPYEAEGYFFSYGSTGNSINIGGTTIAMFDLIPEDRIRFDEAYRNQKKESFVQTKIRDYYSRKNAYSIQVYNEVRDAVIKENEDSGYIFYLHEWRTPKEVAKFLIKDIQALPSPKEKTPTTSVAAVASNTPPGSAPTIMSPAEEQNTPVQTKEDPAITKRRAEIKKIAEEKQIENTTRNAGIDGDQGFELAYWGMKKDDFALLYPQYSTSLATGDVETINYEKGPIAKIEINFISDLMYKVVYVFRIGPQEAMLALGRKIKEKYGLTDREKLDAADPAKADRREPCEGQHYFVNGVCSKCGWSENEVGTPQEQIYTWTGKETRGQLIIRLNAEKTAYTDFILTRENPRIKDDVSSVLEARKKREAEEQKRKILEEYKQIQIK